MGKGALALKTVPRTYADLRRGVEKTLLTGQRRIEEARVRTYWETGRLIHEHLLLNSERADYGAQLIPRLGQDLNLSDSLLYRCLRFARAFPILAARPELSWAHYRALTYIENDSQRKAIEIEAVKKGWTSRELEERIRPINQLKNGAGDKAGETVEVKSSEAVKLLEPKRGTPGIYRLVSAGDVFSVDLGFTSYLDLSAEQSEGFKAGDLVQLNARGSSLPVADAKTSDLFTYRAEVLRVVDGDTFWMKIYLRPGHWLKEKLRLRGLDCPEIDTAEGKAAKRFVEAHVARAKAVTITTTKPDKYDRYLSDIFLKMDSDEEIFLNNRVLECGHAVKKEIYSLSDWDSGGS